MIERERDRDRELDDYERVIAFEKAERRRSHEGQVVIHGRDVEWHQGRQALIKPYMYPSKYTKRPPETALDSWIVFQNHIKVHSGRHRHQGGLVIYVLEGEGYTVVDGERHDWEAGDLLLLPIQEGGVEHQHFNKDDDKPAKWIAFINSTIKEWGSSEMTQIDIHPDFKDLH